MNNLLIQQLIIDEVVKLTQAQGFKALSESRFDSRILNQVLIGKGLNNAEIDKWVAYLHIEGYINLTADDHNRNPTYITLTPKGMAVETSQYFKELYDEKNKGRWKYWVDLISQTVVGVTAIVAVVLSTKSCSKEDKNIPKQPSIQINNTISETKKATFADSSCIIKDSTKKN